MNIEIYKDADHLCKELAEWITSLIEETLTRKEHFRLVLSGGNTPKKLHHASGFLSLQGKNRLEKNPCILGR